MYSKCLFVLLFFVVVVFVLFFCFCFFSLFFFFFFFFVCFFFVFVSFFCFVLFFLYQANKNSWIFHVSFCFVQKRNHMVNMEKRENFVPI